MDASGMPRVKEQFPPGYLLEWKKEKMLLECSEGVRFRLEKIGVDYSLIKHIAITHSHPDHYALPYFYQSVHNKGYWSDRKCADHILNIYAPRFITSNFFKLWRFFHPNYPKGLPMPKLMFHEMPKKNGIEISGLKLYGQKVYHGFGKVEALSYRFVLGNKTLVFSGDTGYCQGIRNVCKNADLFICESSANVGNFNTPYKYGHLNPYLAGQIAKESNVKKLVLVHYTGLNSDDKIKKECRRAGFKGSLQIGKDFQVINL